ncbi:hypothetical protein BGZ94_010364, partial [Podila epigama]
MANNSLSSSHRSDQLSNAELGQQPTRNAQDNAETTPLIGERSNRRLSANAQNPNRRLSGNGSNNNGGTSNNSSNNNKRALTEHARKRIIISLAALSGLLLVILGATLAKKIGSAPERNTPHLIRAKHGAVATEEIHCSEIGVQVLKDGGNAVDAAVASCLCIGTVNMFSAGIGGGGFMSIRLPNGTVEIIDFRETAPAGASPNMYKHNPILAQKGGLSVGVPGEIRGLALAHSR